MRPLDHDGLAAPTRRAVLVGAGARVVGLSFSGRAGAVQPST